MSRKSKKALKDASPTDSNESSDTLDGDDTDTGDDEMNDETAEIATPEGMPEPTPEAESGADLAAKQGEEGDKTAMGKDEAANHDLATTPGTPTEGFDAGDVSNTAKKDEGVGTDKAPENPNPKETSETHVEFGDAAIANIEDHISKAGNEIYEEPEAREEMGIIQNANTTAAFIEVVIPRQPALEAALRGQATAMGLADGSIKPEDAPGAKNTGAMDDVEGMAPKGAGPDSGNSLTGATKASDDAAINPNSPTQVGDTKETAQAASDAKVAMGDVTGPDDKSDKLSDAPSDAPEAKQ